MQNSPNYGQKALKRESANSSLAAGKIFGVAPACCENGSQARIVVNTPLRWGVNCWFDFAAGFPVVWQFHGST